MNGYTALCFAVEKGNEEMIKLLLNQGANIDVRATNGWSPLHIAVRKEVLKIIELLLKNGADIDSAINFGHNRGYTPLCFAVEIGNEEIIKLLLSHGADINTTSNNGVSPLNLAVDEDLQRNEANINSGNTSPCRYSYTLLHLVVENRSEEIVKLLLNKGAKVDSKGSYGITPLHIAAKRGHLQIVAALLEEGAYVDSVFGSIKCGGYTPLCLAVRNRHEKVVKLLLEKGANVDSENVQGNTILYFSVKDFSKPVNLLIVQHLFKYGPDINHQGNRKAFQTAICKCKKEVVEIFLQFGFILEFEKSYDYHKLLYGAVVNGHLRIVEQLLNKREEEIADLSKAHVADANAKDVTENISIGCITNPAEKLNPVLLACAIKREHKEIVDLLLRHGADINPGLDMIPLHISAETGNKEISKMLLYKGANVNANQHNGMTALHLASSNGHIDVVEVLLRCGANVDFGHGSDSTPLHLAAKRGFLDIVNILLKFDVDIDIRDEYGRTPLHVACREGHKLIVVALLKHGSDINCKSGENRLPIDYALGIDFFACYDFEGKRYFPRETIILNTLKCHIVKLKTANLYVNKENFQLSIIPNNEINDIQYKCNEEIARMKSEKINNANVSFFDILTKGTSRIALYAENEDVVQVFRSEDYKIEFPIYGDMIEHNFREGKRRKRLLKEGNKCINILFNNVHELPYTCTRKIFSYLSNNDLKILTDTIFGQRKGLLEQGYRFFPFLFMSLPDFPYECTEKIFSYLSDEDLRILVEACKPANVSLQD